MQADIGADTLSGRVNLEWIPVNCVLCGSEAYNHIFVRKDGQRVTRCSSCGLLYLNPRPNDSCVPLMYDESYFTTGGHGSGYSGYLEGEALSVAKAHHPGIVVLDLLQRFLKPRGKRLVDVGCGSGWLLKLARERGYFVEGVELSAYMAEHAHRLTGAEIRIGTLEKSMFPAETFDVVTAMEVIEHLTHPLKWACEISRILKPGGLLFLTTPNGACGSRYKEEWIGFHHSFEHLAYFDQHTIRTVLERANMRVMRIWTRGVPLALESPAQTSADTRRIKFRALMKQSINCLGPACNVVQRWAQLRLVKPVDQQPFGNGLYVLASK